MAYASFGSTKLDPRVNAAEMNPETGVVDEVGLGVRRGLRQAGSQLNELVGLGAEAVGADEFATSRRAAGRTLREAAGAPELASQMPTWEGVHGVGDAVRFAAGKAGEALPVMGAAVAGGLLTRNPMVGATASMAPFEVGDVSQRQMDDPTTAAQPVAERGLRALGGGVLSSAVGAAGPSMFVRKAAGPIAESMAKRSIGGIVARNAAESVGVNALGGAGGEVIKQVAADPNAQLNAEQIIDAGVAGGVMGLPFGAAGAGMDIARSRGGAVSGAVSGALEGVTTTVKERMAAREAARVAEQTPEPAKTTAEAPLDDSLWGKASALFEKGRGTVDDSVGRVMAGQPLGDFKELATAQGQRLKDLVAQSDNDTVSKVKEWGQSMLKKMPSDDPRIGQVQEFMANAKDQVAQKGMAGMKQAFDAAEVAAQKISRFADAAKQKYSKPNDTPNAKRSEDFSGAEQVVHQALVDSGIAQRRPELFDNAADINRMAGALRQVAEELPRGPLGSDVIARAIDAFGEDTTHVLSTVVKALSGSKMDPGKTEMFFKNLNEIADLQKQHTDLHDFVSKALTDDAQKFTQANEVGDLIALLKDHASGVLTSKGKPTAADQATNRAVEALMVQRFGDKADAVSKMIEKEVLRGQKAETLAKEGDFHEDGERITAEATDRVVKGRGPKNEPVMDPELFKHRKEQGQNYAEQYMNDMRAKYPDHDVRFEKAEGSSTHGHVVAERAANPEGFSAADMDGMRLDTSKYAKSPDRIEVGGNILDTRRVAKAMDKKLDYTAYDEQSRAHRMARMFNEGIARLMEAHGKFDVPDTAVIGNIGGEPFTFGQAKKLKSDTAAPENARIAELRKEYKTASKQDREDILREIDDLKNAELTTDPDALKDTGSEAERPAPKDAQIHAAAKDNKAKDLVNRSNMDGTARHTSDRATDLEVFDNLAAELKARSTAPQRALGDRLAKLADNFIAMSARDQAKLGLATKPGMKPSDLADIINPLADKYLKGGTVVNLKDVLAKQRDYIDNPPADYKPERAKEIGEWAAKQEERLTAALKKIDEVENTDEYDRINGLKLDARYLKEKALKVAEADSELESKLGPQGSTPDPKAVAAKRAAFLERAASGDKALTKELSESTDAKGLQRAINALVDGAADSDAMKAATKRLTELVRDPDVAYDLQRKSYQSAEATDPSVSHASGSHPDVAAYVEKVLGKSVKLAWANFTHAGEYSHDVAQGVIRLSVHALDPMSTAHHESAHAFFAQLRDVGAHDIMSVLDKAASNEHVIRQLNERFKDQPAVLKQLADPEERVAYMYQMWMADKSFTLTPNVRNAFQKVADFVRNALGIWSNDQRALHIMDYFSSGEYAKNRHNPRAVAEALLAPGRNEAIDTARSLSKPLTELADAVMGTGGARLRDTNIPALTELADIMKREHIDGTGKDQGFIQAARVEATKRRTALGEMLEGYSHEHLTDAMEALQSETPAVTPEGRMAAREIKAFLRETLEYMNDAGVDVTDRGTDYFPRVWDTHFISKNQAAFKAMLEPYVQAGQITSAESLLQTMTSRDGNEFGIETRKPGMQHTKERLLSFITAEDAAPFVSKNLFGTLNSYITQAARRAEWERRLGGKKLDELMTRAKKEGATGEQLALAENYMKGIDGTLGDNINPTARRIMGDMIVYQNIRLLPLAAFSSIIDPQGVLVRGGTVADAWSTFKRGMKDIPQTFGAKARGRDQATEWAELVGTVDSAMMSHTVGDLYTQGMVGGTAAKLNNAFFKYNLMEGMNRSFRIGATEAAVKFLARHGAGEDGLGSTQHSDRWMRELNIQKGDVKLTPDGHIALTEADGLSAEQVQRVHAAINQWVDGAILRPDAADKPLWMSDPRFALISHLKQFVFSFQKTILARTMHEVKHGNYAPAMALASYVPMMIAADFAKGIATTGGVPSWQEGWDATDYLEHGVQRAGLLGVGQFGADIAKDVQRGGTGVFALSGPTIEQLRDAATTVGGHRQFGTTVIDAMPANALYKNLGSGADAPSDAFKT